MGRIHAAVVAVGVLAPLALAGCAAGKASGTGVPSASVPVSGVPAASVLAIPVLEYHGISAAPLSVSDAPFSVDVPAFTAQMSWLHDHGYHSISSGQYIAWLARRPVSLPPKPILITFDDGRADSPLALPALHRYGYNATMFVVTAFADQGTAGDKSWESWGTLVSSGWDLQFHAGALGHLTPARPYYSHASLADVERDISDGMAELTAKTSVVSQTWAVPNGAWTPPLAAWAATKFKVIWLEGSIPAEAVARRYHMRYRAEIANGSQEQVSYMVSQLTDPEFALSY